MVDLRKVQSKLDAITDEYNDGMVSYYDTLQKIADLSHRYPQAIVKVDNAITNLRQCHSKWSHIYKSL